MTAYTKDVDDALFLQRFGVPYWGLTRVFGKNDMYSPTTVKVKSLGVPRQSRGFTLINNQSWRPIMAGAIVTQLGNEIPEIMEMHKRVCDLFFQNKFEQSLKLYNQLVKLEPDNGSTWHDRGALLSRFERYNDAIADFQKALAICPAHDSAHYSLGVIFLEQGKHLKAVKHLKEAVKLNNRGIYWYGLAVAQKALKNRKTAMQSIENAIKFSKGELPANVKKFKEFYATLVKTAGSAA